MQQTSMEKVASTTALYHCLPLAGVVGFLILDSILNWANRLHKLYQRILFTDSSRTHAGDWKKMMKENTPNEAREGQEMIRREDVEMVMARMGLLISSRGSDKLRDCMGFDELSTVFEEKEPGLDEVSEAFSVFDDNCDGFIDATELQTVLCKLGFTQGADLDACQQMIEAYDENKDGKIDFNEFAGFMDSCFC